MLKSASDFWPFLCTELSSATFIEKGGRDLLKRKSRNKIRNYKGKYKKGFLEV